MLRKGPSRKTVLFVYPNAEDIALLKRYQMVRKVYLKEVKRGRHIFNLQANEEERIE
jgi:hypothetical protein